MNQGQKLIDEFFLSLLLCLLLLLPLPPHLQSLARTTSIRNLEAYALIFQ